MSPISAGDVRRPTPVGPSPPPLVEQEEYPRLQLLLYVHDLDRPARELLVQSFTPVRVYPR